MIKQIQLRGISRTPSDRMSEDGGLSESLNMFMDTAENAPAFVPEDVTKDLKLPADLQAERIFIHKTANYENYVVVLADKVVAYTPQIEDEEPIAVLDLLGGEKVIDINSLGNTLVIATTANMYYCLFQNRAYSFLGNKVPFPIIDFTKAEVTDMREIKVATGTGEAISGSVGYWFLQDNDNASYIPTESDWNEDSEDGKAHTGHIKECIDDLKKEIDKVVLESATQDGFLTCPIVVRYDIDLYGSSVSSMPIVIPASMGITANINTQKIINYTGTSGAYNRTYTSRETVSVPGGVLKKYKLHAKLDGEWKVEEWKNLITKVRIFISKPTGWNILPDSTILTSREEDYSSTPISGNLKNESFYSDGTIVFREDPNFKQTLLSRTAETFLVKEISLLNEDKTDFSEDFKSLVKGDIIDITKFIQPLGSDAEQEEGGNVQLETQPMLVDTDMQHYITAAEKLDVYNNRLILTQPTQLIEYDFNRLNAYDTVKGASPTGATFTYEVTYVLAGHTEDKSTKKTFTYVGNESIKGFQIFPDSRAYKMLIKYTVQSGSAVSTTYKEYDMLPHPYLDCAYYYGSLSMDLSSLGQNVQEFNYPVNAIDDLDNKLFISEINEPFLFPLEGRFTFQTKVLGVAVANTALSQGQFGQFPLYVFTEDGIWAMETAADGSFISSKPLSREVCSNPESICSIDNAVVFVTDKAVMMISGSQVANISPYMNGRHYVPNASAVNLISHQDGFAEFESAIKDDDPFMKFMKDARTAYDYTGQRLIFISPSNTGFQYVYKIDTQTWHKMAFSELDLDTPLNSYPECLIKGEKDNVTKIFSLSTVLDASRKQETAKGILITRPFDLGMPDVFKSITKIKIRGDYDKDNVKFILQGSDNGRDFYTLTSLRGKSWKMFRIFILADLEPTERISWIDIDFEPRYQNKLR